MPFLKTLSTKANVYLHLILSELMKITSLTLNENLKRKKTQKIKKDNVATWEIIGKIILIILNGERNFR